MDNIKIAEHISSSVNLLKNVFDNYEENDESITCLSEDTISSYSIKDSKQRLRYDLDNPIEICLRTSVNVDYENIDRISSLSRDSDSRCSISSMYSLNDKSSVSKKHCWTDELDNELKKLIKHDLRVTSIQCVPFGIDDKDYTANSTKLSTSNIPSSFNSIISQQSTRPLCSSATYNSQDRINNSIKKSIHEPMNLSHLLVISNGSQKSMCNSLSVTNDEGIDDCMNSISEIWSDAKEIFVKPRITCDHSTQTLVSIKEHTSKHISSGLINNDHKKHIYSYFQGFNKDHFVELTPSQRIQPFYHQSSQNSLPSCKCRNNLLQLPDRQSTEQLKGHRDITKCHHCSHYANQYYNQEQSFNSHNLSAYVSRSYPKYPMPANLDLALPYISKPDRNKSNWASMINTKQYKTYPLSKYSVIQKQMQYTESSSNIYKSAIYMPYKHFHMLQRKPAQCRHLKYNVYL